MTDKPPVSNRQAQELERVAFLTDAMIDAVTDSQVDACLAAIRTAPPQFRLSEGNERRLARIGIAAALNDPSRSVPESAEDGRALAILRAEMRGWYSSHRVAEVGRLRDVIREAEAALADHPVAVPADKTRDEPPESVYQELAEARSEANEAEAALAEATEALRGLLAAYDRAEASDGALTGDEIERAVERARSALASPSTPEDKWSNLSA